jgi:hypothetical protein
MRNADVLIYIHRELSERDRAKVTQGVSGCAGVVSAHFEHNRHPHALIVQYQPDKVKSRQILEVVKQQDPAATVVSL